MLENQKVESYSRDDAINAERDEVVLADEAEEELDGYHCDSKGYEKSDSEHGNIATRKN